MPSLNLLAPEVTTHGTEIGLWAQVAGTPSYIQLVDIYEFDWDEDEKVEMVPTLGSRIRGVRQGAFEARGTIKAYYMNGAVRSMFSGMIAATSGSASQIYASQRAFQRYVIRVQSSNPNTPNKTFINVVLAKSAVKFQADKLTDETIEFRYEDSLGA